MIGKLSLAAALAGVLLLAAPLGASAASLPHTGTAAKPATESVVTPVHGRRWWKHRKYRKHWRQGRYYGHRYHRRRYYTYDPYYYSYSGYPSYYYRPYRRHYYRRHHRPHIGIYLSF